MSQNIAKSMAYITNESGGDLQQGGWLPVQANQWHSIHFARNMQVLQVFFLEDLRNLALNLANTLQVLH